MPDISHDQGRAERPRLLVLASTFPRWRGDHEPGFVYELARHLADKFDITVVCPHADGAALEETLEGVQVKRYRYAPARFEKLVNDGGIVTNLRRAPWMWVLVPTFVAGMCFQSLVMLRQKRFDAVHAHWIVPQGLVASLLRRAGLAPGVLVTSHGADLFALRGRVASALKRFALNSASKVTVVSEPMRQAISALGVEQSRVVVAPMGIDMDSRFVPGKSDQRNPERILFVGRLVEKKGVTHLLGALLSVLESRPDAKLVIAGFGPLEHSLRQQAVELGLDESVSFVGAVAQDALPALYQSAAVFVAPFVESASGDQEGLGLVVIEALACGCPCVVSRLPGTMGVIEAYEGVDGVPPGNEVALAAAIVDALNNPTPVSGRPLEFSWPRRADAYARLLEDIAAKGDASRER